MERFLTPLRDRLPQGRWPLGLAALAVILLLYYPIGMALVSRIDDNLAFAPAAPPKGASAAVAMAAALIHREVTVNGWTANDPFFLPGAALDNMPNFQTGIIAALARFAVEMTDQLGRTRGSSQADPDLERAAGLLKYSGTVWIWDPKTSWLPTASSEKQYRAAEAALTAYNRRLAAGQATFDRRADNLQVTLDRIAADLGSASAALDAHIRAHDHDWIDWKADDLFYLTKGKLYAYALLLRSLGQDFAEVIRARDLGPAWAQMQESIDTAAGLRPWVVIDGPPDSTFLPSHLAAQGFYLLRARTQLREIANILLK